MIAMCCPALQNRPESLSRAVLTVSVPCFNLTFVMYAAVDAVKVVTVPIPASIIIMAIILPVKLKHKIKSIRMKNHTIICNYNDYSKNIILNYLNRKLKIDSPVTIKRLASEAFASARVFSSVGSPGVKNT